MPGPIGSGARGVLVSVSSSVLFAGVYFFTPYLAPASAEGLWGLRFLLTIPLIVLVLLSSRAWPLASAIGRRIRAKPALLLPLCASSVLLSTQIWLFGWAPLHGRGLQVALGYFLLPLVLVVVGRILYRDRLTRWQWVAAGIAAAGVVFELFRVGGISWETLLVAGAYPVYFVLRRSLGTGHLGGMFWDFALAAPAAAFFLIREVVATPALAENPTLIWLGPLYAVVTGLALVCYLTASKLLSLSLFGLLSYLEPALLMVASLANGEQIAPGELVMYGAIWVAVLVILVGGIVQLTRGRRG